MISFNTGLRSGFRKVDPGFARTDKKAKDGVKRRGDDEMVVTKRDRSTVDKGKIDSGGDVGGFAKGIVEFNVAYGLVDPGDVDGPPIADSGGSDCWVGPW